MVSAVIDSVCTFIGALIPLSASMIPHGPSWLGAAVGIGALALLGFFLGRATYGNPVRWAVALTAAGVLVAYIGMNLKIDQDFYILKVFKGLAKPIISGGSYRIPGIVQLHQRAEIFAQDRYWDEVVNLRWR